MIPERIIPRARWTMAGSLAAAVTLAVGHHAFYSHLAGQHPSDPYSPSWGFFSLGITPQQLNLATGSAFAFIVKAFLGLAVSTAHDQAVWQRIRKVPTSTAVIDGMFGARSSLLDALSLRNWRTSFLTMGLALLYWLLPIAAFFTPATLTIQLQALNRTSMETVPRVDFTSLNFATMARTGELIEPTYAYSGPQFEVQRAVTASVTEAQILGITPPYLNSSWTLAFDGPALSCSIVNSTMNNTISENIYAAMNDSSLQYLYLSWTPSYDSVLPFVYNDEYFDLHTATIGPQTTDTRTGYPANLYPETLSPLTLFVAALPNGLSEEINSFTNYTVPVLANATIAQCVLQNVSYTVDFAFTNGVQNVRIITDDPHNAITWSARFRGNTLSASTVEGFSYQAVMHAFGDVLVGSIRLSNRGDPKFYMTSSAISTELANANELEFLSSYNFTNPGTNTGLTLHDMPNGTWNGLSVARTRTPRASMTEILEGMFQNATVSLMTSYMLRPNYSSPYAPPDTNVTMTQYSNMYVYSASILWTAYGIAIAFSLLGVISGFVAVLVNRGTYSTRFSTIMRVAPTLHLSVPLQLEDADGRDPPPKYVQDIVVSFPDGEAPVSDVQTVQYVSVGKDTWGANWQGS